MVSAVQIAQTRGTYGGIADAVCDVPKRVRTDGNIKAATGVPL